MSNGLLVETLGRTLAECEQVIRRGLATFVEVGEALMVIRDQRLYREKGYTRFEDYCQEAWGWTRIRAHQLIEGASVAGLLTTVNTPAPTTERQARELAPLMRQDETAMIETWNELQAEHGDQVTAAKIKDAVDKKLGHHQLISQSNSNEWYTPPEYIEAARAVMGAIDLDPASNEIAQEWIKATAYYTAEDNGLAHEWHGRIWLNPPWGRLTGEFVEKLAKEITAGRVTEAVVLVNAHATDTEWFSPLWDGLLCFTDHRINYVSPDDVSSGSTHGSVFVYFGPNRGGFGHLFGQWGALVRRVHCADQE